MRTHYVSFADNSVAIDYDVDAHQVLVDYLFGDLDSHRTPEPLSHLSISEAKESNRTRLEQDGNKLYAGDCRTTLARTLTEKILYTLVDKDASGLAFHAAAVCAGDTGVLIPGKSGAGKSTLAVWLATRGFNYLTDELVHVPLSTNTIEAFTRPINLKKNGREILEGELEIEDTDQTILKNARLSIVPHRLINPSYKKLKPEISVVVFPHLISDGEHRLEPLSKAQAGLKLVECLVNGRNIENHGIDQVSRIARDVPAYVLHYTGFKTLPGLLGDILPQVRK